MYSTEGHEDPADIQTTIHSAARACRLGLQQCTQTPELIESHWAENRLSDFNLWDAGVGASAKASNSLDIRLQNDIAAKKVVISSLSTLMTWTRMCQDLAVTSKTQRDKLLDTDMASITTDHTIESHTDITLEEAKHSVEQILRVLVSLGVAIRQAGAASRLSNADRTFAKNKPEYSSLVEHLTFLLRVSDISRKEFSVEDGDKEKRIQASHALEEVMKRKEPLRFEQQVLIEANAKRLHRFHHAKARSRLLQVSASQQKLNPDPLGSTKSTQLPSTPKPHSTLQRRSTTPSTSRAKEVEKCAPSQSQQSATSANQLSDHRTGAPIQNTIEEYAALAPPTAIALNADYPKPPVPSQDSTGFVCPYCNLTMLSSIAQTLLWKKHVSEDLQPYTCYFQDCPHNNRLFDTFHAWKTHVFSKHQTFRGWTCFICDEPRNFKLETDFSDHVRTTHIDEVDAADLIDLSTACQTFDEPKMDRCPVCSTYETTWERQKLENHAFEKESSSFIEHIGKCMHDFALRSLPATELVESADEGSGAPTRNSNLDSHSSLSSVVFSIRGEDRDGLKQSDIQYAAQLHRVEKVHDWLADTRLANLEDSDDTAPTRKLSHEINMREGIATHLLQSAFDKTPYPFMPRGSLDEIVTAHAILSNMGISLPTKDDDSLLGFILKRARKVFATMVFADRGPMVMYKTMVMFYNNDFDDSKLPIETWSQEHLSRAPNQRELHPFELMEIPSNPFEGVHSTIWSSFHIKNFQENQRIFLAPVFSTSDYSHNLGEHILPFIRKLPNTKDDFFSTVNQYEIHGDHIKGLTITHGHSSHILTVKQIKNIDEHDLQVKATQWKTEIEWLAKIRVLEQDHIVRFITAFRWGPLNTGFYLVFEWANGGNLLDLWETDPMPTVTAPFIRWFVKQLSGLAQALCAVHNISDGGAGSSPTYSHAKLTPASIYWVLDDEKLGTLKIGDWGELSKIPITYDTRACYAPPEVDIRRVVSHRSKLHDMWAMGCIIFECLVWALDGLDELHQLIQSRKGKFGVGPSFYELIPINGRKSAKVHSTVTHRMERMANDPACEVGSTALGDVLEIVQHGLLIVSLPSSESKTDILSFEKIVSTGDPHPLTVGNTTQHPMQQDADKSQQVRLTAKEVRDRFERISMVETASYWHVEHSPYSGTMPVHNTGQ